MGLFGGSTKTYVSSVVYNLAGDVALRPNYLKSVVSQSVLLGEGDLGRKIVDSHIAGPAMTQRGFFRWAKTRFPHGMVTTQVVGGVDLSTFDYEPYIPKADPANTISVGSAKLINADYTYWAEKHILETDPELISTEWICDYIASTQQVEITYEDLSTELISVPDYDASKRYLFVQYVETTPGDDTADPVIPEENTSGMWIYQIGSGTAALDSLDSSETIPGEFVPFIPLRMWNKGIDHEDYSDIYSVCASAYRQATGEDIDTLLETIEDNEDIDDVDFCSLYFGVPLNTEDNSARIYLYEFFKRMIPYQVWSPTHYDNWAATNGDSGGDQLPEYTSLIMQTDSDYTSSFWSAGGEEYSPFDMRISWVNLAETIGAGLGKPDAAPGDCWFEITPSETYIQKSVTQHPGDNSETQTRYYTRNVETLRLYHQVDEDTFRYLDIRGLEHQNFIYKHFSVDITAHEAINDSDESGFLIPMHIPTMQSMSLVKLTQTCLNNQILVFNCYERVKQKWYQSGFFRVVFSIVIAVVAALVFPGAVGLLGSNLAVGTALGLTGTSALIAGAVANAAASMILSTVINSIVGDAFGEFGELIAVVATFVASQYINSFATTGSFNVDWGEVLRIDNLIDLTKSVSQATQAWSRGRISGIAEDFDTLTEDYETEMEEIEDLMQEILGYGGGVIDPLQFTQFADSSGRAPESQESFLSRTLLTGTDLADLSQSLIEDFSDVSLTLPDYRQ